MKNLSFRSLATCLLLVAAGESSSLLGQVAPFLTSELGTPTHAGSVTANTNNTTSVNGGGADIWNNADSGFYYYTTVTGLVWDARVRVTSFDGPDFWSKVELMARRPDPNTMVPSAADPQMDVCSTRVGGVNDIEYQYRGTRGAGSGNAVANNLTPNYPNEWMRLTRFNTIFRFYLSYDGSNWTQFATQDTATTANGFDGIAWENPTELGIAVTAHNDTDTTGATAVISNLVVTVTPVVPPTSVSVVTPLNGTTNVYAYTEASFNFVGTNNATPSGIYPMNYAWYKNNQLVSTNPMGPNFTFLTTPADNGAQVYCISMPADTNYSSLTVTSAVLTVTVNAGALKYADGLKLETFVNVGRQDVEIGSMGPATNITLAHGADVNISTINGGVNYTERFTGYFTPPTNGAYVFFINADDDADLFLSTDTNAVNKQLVAQETDYSNPYDWLTSDGATGSVTQKRSDQFTPDGGATYPYVNGINLVGGQPYYLEIVHRQGIGGANVAVTFQTTNQIAGPNWPTTFTNGVPSLMQASNGYLSQITWPGTNITWSLQPTNLVLFEGDTANFFSKAVSDSEMAVGYTWYVETSPGSGTYAASPGVTGPELSLPLVLVAQSGTHLYAVANTVEGGLSITSSVVKLTVNQAIFEPGFVKEEKWLGLGNRAAIENGSAGSPTFTLAMPGFEHGANNPGGQGDFGMRLTGYFIAPTNGNYVFFVDSDDDSDLFISTDNTAAHKRQVAVQEGWANLWQWLGIGGGGGVVSQKRSDQYSPDGGATVPFSNGIPMTAGQRYYMEVNHHNGAAGGTHLGVTYKLIADPDPVNGALPKAIGSASGSSAVRCTYVNFTQQPSNTTTAPMGFATFSAAGTTDSQLPVGTSFTGNESRFTNNFLFFQWQKNGVDIAGANSSSYIYGPVIPSDNGAVFTCKMRALGYADSTLTPIWSNSQPATLTVAPQAVFEPGWINVEWWATNNPSRGTVENNSAGPAQYTYATPKFETSVNQEAGDNYANRNSGFFIPPTNGNYTFFLSSDDDSDLFLSTDNTPANKRLIAQEAGWANGLFQWTDTTAHNDTPANRRSDTFTDPATGTQPYTAGIPLIGGHVYYIEDVHHEGGGGDFTAVTYKNVTLGDPDPATGSDSIMAGNLIGTYVARIPWVAFLQQPTNQTALSGGSSVTFTANGFSAPSLALGTTGDPRPLFGLPATNVMFQWYKNGVPIPGATAGTYTQTPVLPSDQGAQFVCGIRALGYSDNSLNPIYSNSVVATLTVVTDTVPPTVSYAATFANTNQDPAQFIVDVTFSKWMDSSTLLNPANYSISGVTITNVTIGSNHRTVQLWLNQMPTLPLTITVTGGKDLSGNSLAANSSVAINPVTLTFLDIGLPGTAPTFGTPGIDPAWPSIVYVEGSNGFVVSAEGSDIWNTTDGFDFGWELKTNDFDVVVQGISNGHTSQFAKMGLMIREDLTAGSREWCAVNDPNPADGIMAPDNSGFGNNQIEFNARTTNNLSSAGWDNLLGRTNPPAYPNAWLRLKRTGNVLDGYFSNDGLEWKHAATYDTGGTNSFGPLTNVVYVGICTTAHNNDGTSVPPFKYYNTAEFANYNSSFVLAQPTVTIHRSGGNVVVSWTPNVGRLLSSPVLGAAANWQLVTTNNPATISVGPGAQFFRVGP